jgi:hypothetical protein
LVLRTVPTDFDEPLRATANGVELGAWEWPPPARGWRQTAIPVPGAVITGSTLELSLEGVAMIFHLWVIEPDSTPAG